jgi:hypothetical protein
MALDKVQEQFIENKVKKLGSKGAVQKFYQKDDAVCKYALKLADKVYKLRRRK